MAAVPPISGLRTEDEQPNDQGAMDIMPQAESEKAVKPNQQLLSRPAPLIWFLVCLGLYLGALLYGKDPLT